MHLFPVCPWNSLASLRQRRSSPYLCYPYKQMSANQPAGVIITRFADGRDAFWLPLSRTEWESCRWSHLPLHCWNINYVKISTPYAASHSPTPHPNKTNESKTHRTGKNNHLAGPSETRLCKSWPPARVPTPTLSLKTTKENSALARREMQLRQTEENGGEIPKPPEA